MGKKWGGSEYSDVLQVLLSAPDEEDVARSINARLLSAGLARYAAPRRKVTLHNLS
jgi:hypothetical protein